MKRFIIAVFFASLAFASCEKYDTIKEVNTDYMYNFEVFWSMVDEQYCYLDYKNIDWEAVRAEMLPRVEAAQTEQQFFNVLEASLDYLRDGHVWMVSPFKTYSCDEYLYDENGVEYPDNFDFGVVKDFYVKEMFLTMENGIYFGEIERDGRTIAYIHYSGFEEEWSDDDYKYIEPIVNGADGLILDIRNNPGGTGETGLTLAGNFFKEKTLVGYHAIKTGSGHNDFSDLQALYAHPSEEHNWADKKTALLTNRHVYSTANLFTSALKQAKNVTQIGGISGGGGAMPMTHYLPNGWLVVFPANALFDVNKQHIENGIAPDIEVNCTDAEFAAGKDAIIEAAIEYLSK